MNGMPVNALDHPHPLARGERDEFECFLHEQREGLLRFLLSRIPNEEDAQDAVQESLVRLARYRHREPSASWRPLLYRIAANVAIDQQRIATTHRAAAHVPYERVLHAVPSDGLAPDEQLDRQQLLTRMWEVVNALPPRCRDIYLLSRVEGMSQRQIAETYGISVKAVEKQMTRALSTLRRELGEWSADTLLRSQDGERIPPV